MCLLYDYLTTAKVKKKIYIYILSCVWQAEKSVAEEEMHGKKRIPHHLTRHSKLT